MTKRFTTEELMDRWEARRSIKNLAVRFITQDYLLRREKDMYTNYWSLAEDVSLGVNEGFYSGAEAVKGYYDAIYAQTKLESELIRKKYPTRLGAKSEDEIYGVGVLHARPLENPVIEIAGDNKTAKGIWCTHAMNVELTPAGQVSFWEWAHIAIDFRKEDGQWRIWHMLYLRDLYLPSGQSWADSAPKYDFPDDELYAELRSFQFPKPNIAVTLRQTYHTHRSQSAFPEYPEPYEAFQETFSYGTDALDYFARRN